MNLRPMIIDTDAQQKLSELKIYAEQHPYSMDDLLDLMNKQGRIAGDDLNFKCFVQVGYCIVFSIEEQVPGLCRHLSMSVDEDRCLPSPPSVEMIMKILGFENGLYECIVKLETISSTRQAINVMEIIK